MTESQTGPSRLLIVDDDEGMRDTLVDILENNGYNVVSVSDGATALGAIQTQLFDLVLMDVRMPVLNGVETLKRLLAVQPGLAVILMSGDPGEEAAAAAQEAVAIVPKPLDLPTVLPLIKALTSERGGGR